MVTIRIKENSKMAKSLLEYIKGFSFVEFVDSSSNESSKKKSDKLLIAIEESLQEVKNIREGKSIALTTKSLWDE